MQVRNYKTTSKSSLWNMEYVARGGALECPRIYRTSTFVYIRVHVHIYNHSIGYLLTPVQAPLRVKCTHWMCDVCVSVGLSVHPSNVHARSLHES